MKLPEYLTSTVRLCVLLFTVVICYAFVVGILDPKDFIMLVWFPFGYFYGSRGSEQSPAPTPNTSVTTTVTDLQGK